MSMEQPKEDPTPVYKVCRLPFVNEVNPSGLWGFGTFAPVPVYDDKTYSTEEEAALFIKHHGKPGNPYRIDKLYYVR